MALQKVVEIFVAVSAVFCLDCAEDAALMQRGESRLGLLFCHRAVVDDVGPDDYVAACARDHSVKTVLKHGLEHGIVSSGAEEDLVACGLRLPDCRQSGIRRNVCPGGRERAVNIDKNQFFTHSEQAP